MSPTLQGNLLSGYNIHASPIGASLAILELFFLVSKYNP